MKHPVAWSCLAVALGALGCGDDGGVDPAAPFTATIRVAEIGSHATRAEIWIHRGGEIHARTPVPATGDYPIEVTPDDSVTVAWLDVSTPSKHLTWLALPGAGTYETPRDWLFVDRAPVQVTIPAAGGADVELLWTDDQGDTFPSGSVATFTPELLEDGPFVVVARSGDLRSAVVVTPGGSATLPAFAPPASAPFVHEGEEPFSVGAYAVFTGAGRNQTLDTVVQATPVPIPTLADPGAGDQRWLFALSGTGQRIVATGLPVMHDLQWNTYPVRATQPTVSYTGPTIEVVEGAGSGQFDGYSFLLDDAIDQIGWHVVAPPGSHTIELPNAPADLGGRPPPSAMISAAAYDNSGHDGWAEWAQYPAVAGPHPGEVVDAIPQVDSTQLTRVYPPR